MTRDDELLSHTSLSRCPHATALAFSSSLRPSRALLRRPTSGLMPVAFGFLMAPRSCHPLASHTTTTPLTSAFALDAHASPPPSRIAPVGFSSRVLWPPPALFPPSDSLLLLAPASFDRPGCARSPAQATRASLVPSLLSLPARPQLIASGLLGPRLRAESLGTVPSLAHSPTLSTCLLCSHSRSGVGK